jgi:dTDP-4-dehydrorhamnose reductase
MNNSPKIDIFITGAGGQVGRELVDLCESRQLNYVAYTSSELDITDEAKVLTEIMQQAPCVVINAAAYTAVDKAETERSKAYAVNRDGPRYLANACKATNAKLIHISTDYVFDGAKQDAYTVNDEPSPNSVYGASKLAGEKAIAEIWQNHLILRVSWVFGQYGNNFVKTMLRLAEDRDSLSVVDDQFGAPTPAAEIARVLIDTCTSKESLLGTQHLESNPGVTWYEFAKAIFSAASQSNNTINPPIIQAIKSDQFPTPVERPKNSKLKSESIQAINWETSLNTMLNVNTMLKSNS